VTSTRREQPAARGDLDQEVEEEAFETDRVVVAIRMVFSINVALLALEGEGEGVVSQQQYTAIKIN
jgi:hypothetical protein